MADITLDFDASQLNAQLEKLRNPKKTRPLMDRIGRILRTDVQMNFRGQHGPDGRPWKPTIRGGQILRDTGRLRNSIDYRVQGDDEVRIGTNLIYARTHQFGATITAKNAAYLRFVVGGKFVQKKSVEIPARPFMGLADPQLAKINAAIDAWIDTLQA